MFNCYWEGSSDNEHRVLEFFEGSLVDFWANNSKSEYWGFTIFPWKFWHHFGFHYGWLGLNNKRLIVGLGFFTIYKDFYVKEGFKA